MNHKSLVLLIVAIVVFTLIHSMIFISDISETTGAAHSGFVNEDLVTVSSPDMYGFVTITGSANSVNPFAKIIVTNLQNEDETYTYADDLGAFQTDMLASSLDYLRVETE